MGQKDFTDWGGRKRKALVRPAQVREKWLRGGGKKEKVGFKTQVDRYKASLARVRFWLKARGCEEGRSEKGSGLSPWWHNRIVRDEIKSHRELQAEYQKIGVLEKVKKVVK